MKLQIYVVDTNGASDRPNVRYSPPGHVAPGSARPYPLGLHPASVSMAPLSPVSHRNSPPAAEQGARDAARRDSTPSNGWRGEEATRR